MLERKFGRFCLLETPFKNMKLHKAEESSTQTVGVNMERLDMERAQHAGVL